MKESRIMTDNPANIDGDTAEVQALIAQQLAEVASDLSDYIETAVTQLSNSERSRLLDEQPKLTPEELAAAYDESAYAGKIARLDGAAKVFLRLANEVAKENN